MTIKENDNHIAFLTIIISPGSGEITCYGFVWWCVRMMFGHQQRKYKKKVLCS